MENNGFFDCAVVTAVYVFSLYAWHFVDKAHNSLSRDDPKMIQRRFLSVIFATVFALGFVLAVAEGDPLTELSLLGFRGNVLQSTVFPLALFVILFLGPIFVHGLDLLEGIQLKTASWESLVDLPTTLEEGMVVLRNYVIAPFTEEVVFRAVMVNLLIRKSALTATMAVLMSSGFFGLAHVHHVVLHMHKTGRALHEAVLGVIFQLCYTTLFGSLVGFVFYRTGHVMGPFIIHMFCNYMGFPNITAIKRSESGRKRPLWQQRAAYAAYGMGMVGFWTYLYDLTDPMVLGSGIHAAARRN